MLFESQIHDFFRWLPSARLKRKKEEIRGIVLQRIRVLQPEDREAFSAAICEKIKQSQTFREAEVVMMYYPIKNEVDLRPLMEEYKDTKTILLPVAHRHSLELRRYLGKAGLHHGKFGIPEPEGLPYEGAPQLIITPGVAFDKSCNRLGRGGGYYDRFLKKYKRVPTIGVAYDFQIVREVPMGRHDRPLTGVVSVSGTYAAVD